MKKYRCKLCGMEWFSELVYDCPDSNPDTEIHPVEEVTELSGEDYAEMWASDLENANRHSLTDLPDIILGVLTRHIDEPEKISMIMMEFYSKGIGL